MAAAPEAVVLLEVGEGEDTGGGTDWFVCTTGGALAYRRGREWGWACALLF